VLNLVTTVQDIQDYASLILWDTLHICSSCHFDYGLGNLSRSFIRISTV